MLILKLLLKKYKAVNQITINRIQNPINPMRTMAMAIKSFVAIMINLPNQYRSIEEKMPLKTSWKRCKKKLNGAIK